MMRVVCALLNEPEKALLTQDSFKWVISGENLSGELLSFNLIKYQFGI